MSERLSDKSLLRGVIVEKCGTMANRWQRIGK